jgi:hypothetical protein
MDDDRATFRLPQATLDAFSSEILQAANVPPEDAKAVLYHHFVVRFFARRAKKRTTAL